MSWAEKDEIVSIRLPRALLKRVDECCKDSGQGRSTFIRGYLEHLVFTDKAFCNYMLRQKKLETAYWEFELVRAEERVTQERLRQLQL